MQEIKFTSHKQYLLGLLFSTKVKEDSYRPKYTSGFLICPNLNDSQTFKSSSCENFFLQCVCYRCNLLRWMFFVPCDNWKTLFFLKVCRYCEIFSTAILSFSLKQVFLKEIRILRYLHNNSVVLILMPSFEKIYPILYLYMLEKLSYVADFFITFFTLLTFLTVPHFNLKNSFFFLKNSKQIWKHYKTKVRTKLYIKIT